MGVLYSVIACLLSFFILNSSWLHDTHKNIIIRVVIMFFIMLFLLCFCKYNVATSLMQVFFKGLFAGNYLVAFLLFGLRLLMCCSIIHWIESRRLRKCAFSRGLFLSVC